MIVSLAVPAFGQDSSAPEAPVEPVEAPSAGAIDLLAVPAAVPNDYVIGPEDVLRIEVWRDSTLSRTVYVRPDGRFSMPLLNEVQAAGLTPERLDAQLTEALKQFITAPEVTVTVMQVNSKSYTVTGAVRGATRYPLIGDVTVFEAINLAGGFNSEWADKKHIIILRGTERYEFNYEDYVKGKNLDKNPNILLQNGDTVLVQD